MTGGHDVKTAYNSADYAAMLKDDALAFERRNRAMDALLGRWRYMWKLYRDMDDRYSWETEKAYHKCCREMRGHLAEALAAEEALIATSKPVAYNSDGYKRRRAERRAAGMLIDPATAEVMWTRVDLQDPYDDGFQYGCTGKVLFARAPGSMWIEEQDLPKATVKAIYMLDELGLLNDVMIDTLNLLGLNDD
jgi:hypothetical protein